MSTHGKQDRGVRVRRRRRRVRRRRGHHGVRAGAEGDQGGRARGRPLADPGRLHERRVAGVRPDGLAGQPHHLGRLARRHRLPQPADLDRQGRGRHHDALGRCHATLHGPRVRRAHDVRRGRGGQPDRLAGDAGGDGALVRQGRAGARLHPPARPPAAAGEQQLQGVRQRRRQGRVRALRHRPLRHQRGAVRRSPGLDPGRLQLPGRQERLEVVDAVPRDPAGHRDRQLRGAPRTPRPCGSTTTPRVASTRWSTSTRRRPAQAGRLGGRGRGQLDRVAAAAADERVLDVPRTGWRTPRARWAATTCAT